MESSRNNDLKIAYPAMMKAEKHICNIILVRSFFASVFVLLAFVVHAQHAFVKMTNVKFFQPDKFFAIGTKVKVKKLNGEKIVGRIDTIFADGLVVKGDTIVFDSIRHFSWKNYPTKKARRQFLIGVIGTGVGIVGTSLLAFASVSHDESSAMPGLIGGSVGIPALLISPFFLASGYWHIYAWHGRKIGNAWKMKGVLS
jgi:hypothetical protein